MLCSALNEPSQHNEPPIKSSKSQVPSHEDTSTCEPEPELVPLLPTLSLLLMICLLAPPPLLPQRSQPPPSPAQSSPHSHNEAWKEFAGLQPTLMIPQAIVHNSIN
ncbi:hypothetical protein O181_000687 [Austropuccinia psidii MF-1]|uniref:Uncharacterized protein n=1 Tax=Austropuccinia psidii MF-1 TaxID=1389203 RepID=A0A9Q3B948_9BASI|nr:hypothetical protein [Austropuccinia psidii MF-1]